MVTRLLPSLYKISRKPSAREGSVTNNHPLALGGYWDYNPPKK
jgi:hypothetical protein